MGRTYHKYHTKDYKTEREEKKEKQQEWLEWCEFDAYEELDYDVSEHDDLPRSCPYHDECPFCNCDHTKSDCVTRRYRDWIRWNSLLSARYIDHLWQRQWALVRDDSNRSMTVKWANVLYKQLLQKKNTTTINQILLHLLSHPCRSQLSCTSSLVLLSLLSS